MTVRRRLSLRAAVLALALPLAPGCGEENKSTPAAPSASVPVGPVLDGALGEAAADITKGQPKPGASASAAAAEGPPPNNMFTPEGAERAHPKAAPPKLELMTEGSEPRLQLGASRPEGKQEMLLVVAITSGQQQALPPMAVRLMIGEKVAKADAPKAGGPKPAKSAEPAAEPPPPGETAVVATLVEAAVAGMPSDNVPKQLTEAMAKLKGSTISWNVGPNGPGQLTHTLAKGADEGLDIALQAVEEALGSTLLPVPSKAVGEGATWMVTDRSTSMGLDAVRYRFVQLEKVEGDRATLAVQIRKYAASDRLDLPLGPQMSSASIDKLESQGKIANLVLIPRAWVPDSAEISSKLAAQLAPPGAKNPGAQQQQRMQVQLEVAGQLRSPAAIAAASRGGGERPAAPPAPAPAPIAP
jgi:hypothetical protein